MSWYYNNVEKSLFCFSIVYGDTSRNNNVEKEDCVTLHASSYFF